jgi:hypothetical protein
VWVGWAVLVPGFTVNCWVALGSGGEDLPRGGAVLDGGGRTAYLKLDRGRSRTVAWPIGW